MLSETLEKIRLIVDTLGEDDPDLNEIIQNETNIDFLLDKLVFKYACEADMQEAINSHIDTLSARHASSQKRQESLKNVIQIIMETLPDKTKRLSAGTITLKAVAPKVVVTDEALLPDDVFETKTVKKLVKAKVDELYQANGSLAGCYLTNGGQTISIRRN
jgi:hypothetical protein